MVENLPKKHLLKPLLTYSWETTDEQECLRASYCLAIFLKKDYLLYTLNERGEGEKEVSEFDGTLGRIGVFRKPNHWDHILEDNYAP